MDTSGFYCEDNGQILCGPSFVLNKDFELFKELKDTYNYPIQGWYWFESIKLAYEFFGYYIEPVDPS